MIVLAPCERTLKHEAAQTDASRSGVETIGGPFPVFQNIGNNIALHRETNNNKILKDLSYNYNLFKATLYVHNFGTVKVY